MRRFTSFVLVGLGLVACETTTKTDFVQQTQDAGTFDGGTTTLDGGMTYTVECSHPGAVQPPLADGKCACPQTLGSLSGTWKGYYTCGENGVCVNTSETESFDFVHTGNQITAGEATGFQFSGTVCGAYFTWTGGPADQKYVECGTIQFLDADRYVKDSCYAYGADGGAATCNPTFASGCPGQSGQCTNTAARLPLEAAAITKVICN